MTKKTPLNKNIYRINVGAPDEKRFVRGYEVRFLRGGKRFSRFFMDSLYGGPRAALLKARILRDEMEEKFKCYTRKEIAEKTTAKTTSGHRGVRFRTTVVTRGKDKEKYVYEYVEASWNPQPKEVIKKLFSVEKYGLEKAWELAIEYRRKAVEEL